LNGNEPGDPLDIDNSGSRMLLDEGERKFLLNLARSVLIKHVEGRTVTVDVKTMEGYTSLLGKPSGVFVTLRKSGELRGCIGYIRGVEPLYRAVMENTVNAAGDPRFSPVIRDELDEITIEISVLTPMKRISDPEEVEIGRDGLYIKEGFRSGLLLPQVAVEQGWSRREFLEYTCRKAGLERNAWSGGAKLFTFQARIFSE